MNSLSGSILKFTTDSVNPNDLGKLSRKSTLSLLSNTIVENTGFSTFLYDSIGTKELSYNVLAFNSDKSCRYLPGQVATVANTLLSLSNNALDLTGTNSVCDVSNQVLGIGNSSSTSSTHNTLDVVNNPRSNYLSDLQPATADTAFLPVYFPLDLSSTTDFVNIDATACSAQDQRNFTRITDGTLILDPINRNTCEIGSIEISKLTAADIQNLANENLVNSLNLDENELNFNQNALNDPTTDPEFLPQYRSEITRLNDKINGKKTNTHYRVVYADPFKFSLPNETLAANGSRTILPLNKANYSVTATAVGVGSTITNAASLPVPSLSCEWDPLLQLIKIYKKTDEIAQAGEAYYCKYTLTVLNSNPIISSTGVLKVSFANIAPIAKDDEYSLRYGSDQALNVNLLSNDSDDGDGPTAELTNANKAKFYKDAAGLELPIRIDSIPNGLIITPERSGPCPGLDNTKTCFGGNLNIQVRNNFNPFDFTFKYYIYDAEGLISNQANVKLINTANNVGQ